MSDIVVTVPKSFLHPCAPGKVGLAAWIAEGDAAGTQWSGTLWSFTTYGGRPNIQPGERVYIVCEARLRGYAPLVELRYWNHRVELIRGGGAVAVTLPDPVTGFRGWKYRWWQQEEEIPFDDWRQSNARAKRQLVLFGDA